MLYGIPRVSNLKFDTWLPLFPGPPLLKGGRQVYSCESHRTRRTPSHERAPQSPIVVGRAGRCSTYGVVGEGSALYWYGSASSYHRTPHIAGRKHPPNRGAEVFSVCVPM
jgi:hypothetical protein